MRITAKGQVTIPADIRERFGFMPNTEVEFRSNRGKVYLVKSGESSVRGPSLIASMKGKSDVNMTTDEILALTRSDE